MKLEKLLECQDQKKPFPGPGLAIRLICHDKNEEVKISEEEVNKLNEILENSSENGYIIPIKSVGVQGDCRSYRNLCLIGGEKIDFDWKTITNKAKQITDKQNMIKFLVEKMDTY